MKVEVGKSEKQKIQKINFLKELILGCKENLLKNNSYYENINSCYSYKIEVNKLPFESDLIEDVLVVLLNEEKISLKELEKIGFPSTMVDYVSAIRWLKNKEELYFIANLEDDYDKALVLVGRVYAEKMDLSKNPQSRHLIAVSNALTTKEGKIAGLLHDIVEDGYLTLMSLYCLFHFPARIVRAVAVLTRDKEKCKTYDEYIKKQILPSKSLVVQEVKMADMENNQSPERTKDLPTEERRQHALTKYKPYIPLVDERIEKLKLERKRRK